MATCHVDMWTQYGRALERSAGRSVMVACPAVRAVLRSSVRRWSFPTAACASSSSFQLGCRSALIQRSRCRSTVSIRDPCRIRGASKFTYQPTTLRRPRNGGLDLDGITRRTPGPRHVRGVVISGWRNRWSKGPRRGSRPSAVRGHPPSNRAVPGRQLRSGSPGRVPQSDRLSARHERPGDTTITTPITSATRWRSTS